MYNEEEGIVEFLSKQLLPVLTKLEYDTEVVLVDDGSRDKTVEKIVEKYGNDLGKKMKIIALARNFGKEIALTAGLNNAAGNAAIMIDADGQHPVEMIPEMVKKWKDGAQIVTAVRDENTTKHKLGSKIYYAMMKMCGNKNIVVGAMDYRLLDRGVVDEFNKMTERNRLTRGLVDWLGYPQEYIKVHTKDRVNGNAVSDIWIYWGVYYDGVTCFRYIYIGAAIYVRRSAKAGLERCGGNECVCIFSCGASVNITGYYCFVCFANTYRSKRTTFICKKKKKKYRSR